MIASDRGGDYLLVTSEYCLEIVFVDPSLSDFITDLSQGTP